MKERMHSSLLDETHSCWTKHIAAGRNTSGRAILLKEQLGYLWMDLRKILANPLRTIGIQPT